MAQRVDARTAHEDFESHDALLVCAYDDEKKCRDTGVDEALTMRQFVSRLDSIPKSREIVFYCN